MIEISDLVVAFYSTTVFFWNRVGSDESYPVDSEGEEEEEVIASNVLPDIVNHLLTSTSGVETACEMKGLPTNSAILFL